MSDGAWCHYCQKNPCQCEDSMIDPLLLHPNLCYLATAHSSSPYGLDEAFKAAALIAGDLLKRHKVNVYSPICHTHPMAEYANLPHADHNLWLPFDELMMTRCDVLLVATCMVGWDVSRGVDHEITYFGNAGKPIFHVAYANGEYSFKRVIA